MTQFQVGPPAVAGLSHRARPSGDSESRTPGRPAAGTSPLPTSKGLSRCLPSGPPAGTAKLVQRQPASLSEAASDSDSRTRSLSATGNAADSEKLTRRWARHWRHAERDSSCHGHWVPQCLSRLSSQTVATPRYGGRRPQCQCHGSEAGPAALGTLNTVMKANFD